MLIGLLNADCLMHDQSTIGNHNRQSQSAIEIGNRQSAIGNRTNRQSSIGSPQSMKSIVVHYQEIALKGNNRPWFIARLARNLREATKDLDVREVRVLMGRIEVVLDDHAQWPDVRSRLSRV